jgi:hypothetical protein
LRQRLKDWVIKEQWISRKYVPTVEIFGSTMSGLALDGSAGMNGVGYLEKLLITHKICFF